MKIGALTFFFSLLIKFTFSLENNLMIKPVFGTDQLLQLDTPYMSTNKNDLKFKTLKFYLSDIQFSYHDEIVYSDPNRFHLIDAGDESTLLIPLSIRKDALYTTLSFTLGIDSLTSVSGVYSGDLDPMHGMYWTWQSGYINFKLEGNCSNCQPEGKDFEFHLGGYQSPFNAMQKVSLETNGGQIHEISLDLRIFMEEVDLSRRNHIMSPCSEAVLLSKLLAKCFLVRY